MNPIKQNTRVQVGIQEGVVGHIMQDGKVFIEFDDGGHGVYSTSRLKSVNDTALGFRQPKDLGEALAARDDNVLRHWNSVLETPVHKNNFKMNPDSYTVPVNWEPPAKYEPKIFRRVTNFAEAEVALAEDQLYFSDRNPMRVCALSSRGFRRSSYMVPLTWESCAPKRREPADYAEAVSAHEHGELNHTPDSCPDFAGPLTDGSVSFEAYRERPEDYSVPVDYTIPRTDFREVNVWEFQAAIAARDKGLVRVEMLDFVSREWFNYSVDKLKHQGYVRTRVSPATWKPEMERISAIKALDMGRTICGGVPAKIAQSDYGIALVNESGHILGLVDQADRVMVDKEI